MPAPTAISTASLPAYLDQFAPLIGDRRTATTFREIVAGILAAGSLVAARIAAKSPLLAQAKDAAQRVLRFATGETTKRSQLDAPNLVNQLAQCGRERLRHAPDDQDIWLIIDGSELRKPHSRALPDLMKVRDLDGQLVPGYRTINVIGVIPQQRVLLYHRLFSSQEQGFISEPREVQEALQSVSRNLAELRVRRAISWIMDTGFDDIAVWRTIWEQDEHVVCRLKELDRLVEYSTGRGAWQRGHLRDSFGELRELGRLRTLMEVRLKGQRVAKEQEVVVVLSACRLRLTYESNVRREGPGAPEQREVGLLRVEVADSLMEPWYILTDWTVETRAAGRRIFRMYRQRWSVEDSFAFIKGMLGWEEVQVLDLQGIRTLVALGWVAAGYLYAIQGSWEEADIEWLAKLGGWSERKDRKPGKTVLARGLRSILDYLVTRAELEEYRAQHGRVPPAVIALLGEDGAGLL
jgi:hypothetical protein